MGAPQESHRRAPPGPQEPPDLVKGRVLLPQRCGAELMARVCQPRARIQQHQHEEEEARMCMRAGNHKFSRKWQRKEWERGSRAPSPAPGVQGALGGSRRDSRMRSAAEPAGSLPAAREIFKPNEIPPPEHVGVLSLLQILMYQSQARGSLISLSFAADFKNG